MSAAGHIFICFVMRRSVDVNSKSTRRHYRVKLVKWQKQIDKIQKKEYKLDK